MHYRWYNPRLGTFLTPDFRSPNIYDPSTFTEPYAYAKGNPIMYWDLDGLAELRMEYIDPYTQEKKWILVDFLQLVEALQGNPFSYTHETGKNWIGWPQWSEEQQHTGFGVHTNFGHFISQLGKEVFQNNAVQPFDLIKPNRTGGKPYQEIDIKFGASTSIDGIIFGYESVQMRGYSGLENDALFNEDAWYWYIGLGSSDVTYPKNYKETADNIRRFILAYTQIADSQISNYPGYINKESAKLIAQLSKHLGKEALSNLQFYVGNGRRTLSSDWEEVRDLSNKYNSEIFYNEDVLWKWYGQTTSITPLTILDLKKFKKAKNQGVSKKDFKLWKARLQGSILYYFSGTKSENEKIILFLDTYTGYFGTGGIGYGPIGMDIFLGHPILDKNFPHLDK
jgi:hypothetical protein